MLPFIFFIVFFFLCLQPEAGGLLQMTQGGGRKGKAYWALAVASIQEELLWDAPVAAGDQTRAGRGWRRAPESSCSQGWRAGVWFSFCLLQRHWAWMQVQYLNLSGTWKHEDPVSGSSPV